MVMISSPVCKGHARSNSWSQRLPPSPLKASPAPIRVAHLLRKFKAKSNGLLDIFSFILIRISQKQIKTKSNFYTNFSLFFSSPDLPTTNRMYNLLNHLTLCIQQSQTLYSSFVYFYSLFGIIFLAFYVWICLLKVFAWKGVYKLEFYSVVIALWIHCYDKTVCLDSAHSSHSSLFPKRKCSTSVQDPISAASFGEFLEECEVSDLYISKMVLEEAIEESCFSFSELVLGLVDGLFVLIASLYKPLVVPLSLL